MSVIDSPDASEAALLRSLNDTLRNRVIQQLQNRLAHITPIEAPVMPDSRLAAVAALVRLVDASDDPELLFIKRAVVARDPWSGHVAFPGGRHEVSDDSLVETAVRETREEMSMDIGTFGKLIGQLDDLAPRTPALPPVIVRPYVFVVPAELSFTRNVEVADAFWIPVSMLRSAEAKSEYSLVREGVTSRFPAYGVGVNTIWGLTERIVTQFLALFD